jgi:hypothetical protein
MILPGIADQWADIITKISCGYAFCFIFEKSLKNVDLDEVRCRGQQLRSSDSSTAVAKGARLAGDSYFSTRRCIYFRVLRRPTA